MGEVHHLIATHGAEAARAMASTKGERQAVDAAAAIMAEEAFRLGVTHAGFAMTSLPHKRIVDPVWRREGAMTTLLVEAGRSESGASIRNSRCWPTGRSALTGHVVVSNPSSQGVALG